MKKTIKAPSKPQHLRYSCKSVEQRESLLQAIFDAAVLSHTFTQAQEFEVTKLNRKTKKVSRLLRLCQDCILTFASGHFKREIPYSCIYSIYIPKANPSIVVIKFMHKGHDKKHIYTSNQATDFYTQLNDAMTRFRYILNV